MKVLVIGSGGREHTLVWKLSQSKKVDKIYAIPGNGGMYEMAECYPLFDPEKDIDQIVKFARENKVDLTVVGPEDPLSGGIVDAFQKNRLKVFGPIKKAAQIEASKCFAKRIMNQNNVPTGRFAVFADLKKALTHIKTIKYPTVIKADGLAKGKGVFIVNTFSQAKNVLDDIMKKKAFGPAGEKVVIEEFLQGKETTVLGFSDGHTVSLMPLSRDYKRLKDHNKGPNTGGMGAFAPVRIPGRELQYIKDKIFLPTLRGLEKEGAKYKGVLYAGLIKTDEGYKVLEFNCRFGDPETQVVLPLLKTDLVDILMAVIEEKLDKIKIKWKKRTCIAVVMASGGYPGKYEKGIRISGLRGKKEPGVMIFHAGTKVKDNVCCTNGGRVLNVTAVARTFEKASKMAYNAMKDIYFKGMVFRKDIGS
ncbi:MAG: phosphoribosylamine--glycine ligase [Spirochaetes bacterium]|nr:phosphoribosylamine--glycine ligase [Spirochaetota bacterium]